MEQFQKELQELLERHGKVLVPVLNIEIRDIKQESVASVDEATAEEVTTE